MRFLFRIKTQNEGIDKMKVSQMKRIEINAFRALFCNFIVGLKDLTETNGFVPLVEVLNPYKLKILPIGARNHAKSARINIKSIFKLYGRDLVFIEFQLDSRGVDFINKVLKPSDRSYRKYKLEFSKYERSLLWRIRNTPQNIHKDIWEEDGVPAWENQPQTFLSESEWKWERYIEKKRKRRMTINYIKTLKKVDDVIFWQKWERVVKLYS